MTTKLHALCASEADAVAIHITAGPLGEAPVGEALIDAIAPRERIEQAVMDKADDSNPIRTPLQAQGITPVIPPQANRLESLVYDQEGYQQRHKVERLFNKLTHVRRLATRYEKRIANFLAVVLLALSVSMLR